MAPRRLISRQRRRRSVVVLVGSGSIGDAGVRALTVSLGELGIETTYLGQERDPHRIATAAIDQSADAVEICVAGSGAISILKELLREFIALGRRDVSIVVHRVERLAARAPL